MSNDGLDGLDAEQLRKLDEVEKQMASEGSSEAQEVRNKIQRRLDKMGD
jgi:hypothetical protein